MSGIRNFITGEGHQFTEVKSDRAGFTAFFYVQQLSYDQKEDFYFAGLQFDDIYFLRERRTQRYHQIQALRFPNGVPPPAVNPRDEPTKPWEATELAHIRSNETESRRVWKRATQTQQSIYWELSQISSPKDQSWMQASIQEPTQGGDTNYKYHYHDSAGLGQYIYAVETSLYLTHDVSLSRDCLGSPGFC